MAIRNLNDLLCRFNKSENFLMCITCSNDDFAICALDLCADTTCLKRYSWNCLFLVDFSHLEPLCGAMWRCGVNAALHIRRVSRKQWFFLQLSTSKHDFRSYINKVPDRESTKVWVFSWACAWSTYNTVRKLRELFHGGQYLSVIFENIQKIRCTVVMK